MFAWLTGKQFDPPTAPLRDYWVTAQVMLLEALPIGDTVAVGYIRILGIRCTPLRLQGMIEEAVDDGSVVWKQDDTHWAPVSLNELSRDLRGQIDPVNDECRWYQSGRVFFPES